MENDDTKQRGLIVGAVVGAILGVGTAYLLMTNPSDEQLEKPIDAKDLLGVTGSAAAFIRKFDDLRRRL